MMLKSINTIYIVASLLLYLILSPKITGEYVLVNCLTVLSFISYYSILQMSASMNSQFYKKSYLWIEVFLYSFLFVAINNIVSYYYNDNFFAFNESDALGYHYSTIEILHKPFIEGVNDYLRNWDVDDLGIILVIYPFYYIVESNLILNLFYIFVGTATALGIFSIGKNFMSKKYAFLSALAYSIASFTIYFHSTGLKESFMIMLIILTYAFYYRFLATRKLRYIILGIIFILPLLLFRPALLAIIVGSIGLGTMLTKNGGVSIKIFSFFIILLFIVMGNYIYTLVMTYFEGGYEYLLYAKRMDGMIIGSLPFTYVVNVLAQMLGPLPSLVSEKVGITFFSAGLLYRVLLVFPFWMAIFYIYKTKNDLVYPLIIFVITEMLVLVLLLEGLELRKSMPHIPLVFIIAFWFLDKYDRKIITFRKPKRFQYFFNFSMFMLILLVAYWNFR